MIRISVRPTSFARRIAERGSLAVLVFLAVLSLAAVVEHIRVASEPIPVAVRQNPPRPQPVAALPTVAVHPTPPPPPATVAPSPVLAPAPPPVLAAQVSEEPHRLPAPETKTPELPEMARILPPIRDTVSGEADRNLPASGTATVTGRRKDVPMLRDDAALETWGGEFAGGDSRLKEMIQAGALTSVAKGTQVKVLEVRGPLTHVEIVGQNRTGWIRSSSIGR